MQGGPTRGVGYPLVVFAKSFDEGVRAGGEIVYNEPQQHLEVRVHTEKVRTALLSVMFSLIGAMMFIASPSMPNPILWVAASIGTFAVGVYVTYSCFAQDNRLTPSRVYRNGISVGEGTKPFYPFSEVACIEEVGSGKRSLGPVVVFTFKNDATLLITPRRSPDSVAVSDYKKIAEALRAVTPWGTPTSLEWEPQAREFLGRLDVAQGPFVVQIERKSRSAGKTKVTADFVRREWEDAAWRAGERTFFSARVAAKASFGRASTTKKRIN